MVVSPGALRYARAPTTGDLHDVPNSARSNQEHDVVSFITHVCPGHSGPDWSRCVASPLGTSPSRTPSPDPAPSAPPPLTVAACLVAAEAVAFVLLAVFELADTEGEKLALGLGPALFFVASGAFLAYAAWRLYRLHSWARAPLVLAQIIQVLVGGSFWGGSTTVVAVVM